MTRVVEANLTQPSDWVPTAEQIEQMWAAVNSEAYPPAQRNGVGSVLRVLR